MNEKDFERIYYESRPEEKRIKSFGELLKEFCPPEERIMSFKEILEKNLVDEFFRLQEEQEKLERLKEIRLKEFHNLVLHILNEANISDIANIIMSSRLSGIIKVGNIMKDFGDKKPEDHQLGRGCLYYIGDALAEKVFEDKTLTPDGYNQLNDTEKRDIRAFNSLEELINLYTTNKQEYEKQLLPYIYYSFKHILKNLELFGIIDDTCSRELQEKIKNDLNETINNENILRIIVHWFTQGLFGRIENENKVVPKKQEQPKKNKMTGFYNPWWKK